MSNFSSVKKKGKRPLSVEIKTIRRFKNGSAKTDAVSKPRLNDDLIAIVFNTEYVLIEPMEHHLKSCGPKGTRAFTKLC